MIERYLAELARLLPWTARRRALLEIEDHLRTSAAEHGEEEALRRFGPAAEVARGLASVHAARALALAGAAALALAAVPLLAYGIVENHLPPAPWLDGTPPHLEWKLRAATALYVVALASLGLAALAFGRRRRVTLAALGAAVASIGAMGVLGGILNAQWADAVPSTPGWLPLVGAAQVGAALIAALPLVDAARR
jgi:hypothetical protein